MFNFMQFEEARKLQRGLLVMIEPKKSIQALVHPLMLLQSFLHSSMDHKRRCFHAMTVLAQVFLALFMQRLTQMKVIKSPCLSCCSPLVSTFPLQSSISCTAAINTYLVLSDIHLHGTTRVNAFMQIPHTEIELCRTWVADLF